MMGRRFPLVAIVSVVACGDPNPSFEVEAAEIRVDPLAPGELAFVNVVGIAAVGAGEDGGEVRAAGLIRWGPDNDTTTSLDLAIVHPTPALIPGGGSVRITAENVGTLNEALLPLCGNDADARFSVWLSTGEGSSIGASSTFEPFRLDCGEG